MTSLLSEISLDYQNAEITCMFLHNKKTKENINLLTVFELIPSEQQESLLIRNKSFNQHGESVNGEYSIFITRAINLDLNDTINKYENIEAGLNLKYENFEAHIKLNYDVKQEPPNYNPLLIYSNEEKTIGRILPKRNTAFRVWSKLNTNKDWLKDFDNRFFDKIGLLSRKYLNYDLSSIPEHIGNIYLFACNPLLRNWKSTLLDSEKDLLVTFFERQGKSIIGCKLVIEEERSKNNGFNIVREITNKQERIELPYFPDTFRKKIFDAKGNLLENSLGTFLNLKVDINVQETVMQLTVETKDGEEVYSIPKTSRASTVNVGNYDFSLPHFLRDALINRRYEELETNKEFIFFPKHENSQKKAQQTIRELLNKARKKCMILDPYFGAKDLIYAFTIQNVSIPVQIISSANFLKDKIESSNQQKKTIFQKFWNCLINSTEKVKKEETRAFWLLKKINEFKQIYRLQNIECKVLKGNKKSPLHDRYIIVDDAVYLLGSSLNEFGTRATTIIKVPTPKKMIEQANEWWNNEDICPTLEAYLNSISD